MLENKIVLTQNRLRSPALWVSLSAFLLYVLKNVFKLDIDSETWNTVVDMALIVLTAAGVFNNPTDKKNF
jgi:uncharacterized membrane protein